MVGRQRKTTARPAVSGLRHPRARSNTSAAPGQDYTWFILNARIIAKEFALSGQEQNPDLTSRSVRGRAGAGEARRAGARTGIRRPRRGLRQRTLAA